MKITLFGQDARDSLKRGIDFACDQIKITLGPSGRNAVLGRVDIPPYVTNDGVSIARHAETENEIENQGVWIVKEACSVASNKGGDGTTTTAVLLQAITNAVFDKMKDDGSMIKTNHNPVAIKKEIDEACQLILSELTSKSRKITDEEINNVALTAGEYQWIADIVSEVFKKIGKDGYVTIEDGVKTEFEIFKGIELGVGFHSEYFVNTGDKCILDNPKVLVTNQPLDTNKQLIDVIIELAQKEIGGLVIVAPDFSKDLLNRLITTKLKAGFSAVAIKLPTYDKDDILKDVATLTQAKFLDKNTFTSYDKLLEDIKSENLGSVDKADITSGKTILLGGNGDTSERVIQIKKQIEEASSLFDKDNLEKRLAYLSGGIAVIKVGAESDFEKTYFRLKMENAVASAQEALKNGVVKGGGLALKEVAETLSENILTEAIKAPYQQIQENAGGHLDIGDSIIDPLNVTVSALKSACSLAGMLITTEVAVAFKNKKDEDKN